MILEAKIKKVKHLVLERNKWRGMIQQTSCKSTSSSESALSKKSKRTIQWQNQTSRRVAAINNHRRIPICQTLMSTIIADLWTNLASSRITHLKTLRIVHQFEAVEATNTIPDQDWTRVRRLVTRSSLNTISQRVRVKGIQNLI